MRDPLDRRRLEALAHVAPSDPLMVNVDEGGHSVTVEVRTDGVVASLPAPGHRIPHVVHDPAGEETTEHRTLVLSWDGTTLAWAAGQTVLLEFDRRQVDKCARVEQALADLRRQAAWADDGLPLAIRVTVDRHGDARQPDGDTVIATMPLFDVLVAARNEIGVRLGSVLDDQQDGTLTVSGDGRFDVVPT